MGVYALTPIEPLPPIYIFESGSKDDKRIRVKTDWIKNLPTVYGKWGFNKVTAVDSHVVV